jgi:hypothetical protein
MTKSKCRRFGRRSQARTILAMLRDAREEGRAVEIPEMMRAGISAFNGRIRDLRQACYGIENEMWRDEEGKTHSQYSLTYDPEQDA